MVWIVLGFIISFWLIRHGFHLHFEATNWEFWIINVCLAYAIIASCVLLAGLIGMDKVEYLNAEELDIISFKIDANGVHILAIEDEKLKTFSSLTGFSEIKISNKTSKPILLRHCYLRRRCFRFWYIIFQNSERYEYELIVPVYLIKGGEIEWS